MGLTKSNKLWSITLTQDEFTSLKLALRDVTNLDNLIDMIGSDSSGFLFDLDELLICEGI